MPGLLQIAAWRQHTWLRAGFSTRAGGVTTTYGATGEQNLGWTAEDAPANVAANRQAFIEAVAQAPDAELVTLRQVHGAAVVAIRRGSPLHTPDGRASLEGDGLITSEPRLLLGIQTADCVPILIADTRTHAVGAFHAGWRGTVARIAERGIDTMAREFGSRPEDLIAAIGPSIGPCCFEVGDEVVAEFERAFPYASDLVSQGPGAQPHIDLWEANRRQLLAAGLRSDAISVVAECTACTRTPDGLRKYFSHRAEHGMTGRMLNVIGVIP